MGDNYSLEPFFNDHVSDPATTIQKRDLRIKNINVPIEGYQLSESETNSGTSVTNYYGFENKEGEWYITKQVRSGVLTTYTFAKGDSDFATSWGNRATTVVYDTFANTF